MQETEILSCPWPFLPLMCWMIYMGKSSSTSFLPIQKSPSRHQWEHRHCFLPLPPPHTPVRDCTEQVHSLWAHQDSSSTDTARAFPRVVRRQQHAQFPAKHSVMPASAIHQLVQVPLSRKCSLELPEVICFLPGLAKSKCQPDIPQLTLF